MSRLRLKKRWCTHPDFANERLKLMHVAVRRLYFHPVWVRSVEDTETSRDAQKEDRRFNVSGLLFVFGYAGVTFGIVAVSSLSAGGVAGCATTAETCAMTV